MSEPAPVHTRAPAEQSAPYRPVSGLAIAGLILSGLFTGWVVSAGVIAFYNQTPFLMSPVSFLLPVAGFGLSLAGRIQIRRSEGTRAGAALATCGLWLSILFGLGYAAYRGATELALRQQAKDFTNTWFELLRGDEVDVYAAFWDSLNPSLRDSRVDLDDPEQRQMLRDNPKKFNQVKDVVLRAPRFLWGEARGGGLQKGELPHFFTHELVETVHQSGGNMQVEAQGIRSWEHLSGSEPGYQVEQSYRVVTPEGEFDVSVMLVSSDDKDGRRRWRVVLPMTAIRGQKLTPRGEAAARLRLDSRRFASDWINKLVQGQLGDVYLGTSPPQQRDPLRSDYLAHLVASFIGTPAAGGGPVITSCAILANPKKERGVFLSGFPGSLQVGLLRGQAVVAPDDQSRAAVLEAVAALLRTSERDGSVAIQLTQRAASSYEVTKDGTEIRFVQPFEMRLGTSYRCEGNVIVASNSPAATAALAGSSPEGLRLIGESRNVFWWVAGLELDMAVAQKNK
jgi:hypothetical protein